MFDCYCICGCVCWDEYYVVCVCYGGDYMGVFLCMGCVLVECCDGLLICDCCFGWMCVLFVDGFDLIG